MRTIELGRWQYYCHQQLSRIQNCGKWIYRFHGRDNAKRICQDIVQKHIVEEAKHTNADVGICCFFINGLDFAAHKRVLQYMMSNGLINKAVDGTIVNVQFSFDEQTRIEQDQRDEHVVLRVSDFVNLQTGRLLPDEDIKKKEVFA